MRKKTEGLDNIRGLWGKKQLSTLAQPQPQGTIRGEMDRHGVYWLSNDGSLLESFVACRREVSSRLNGSHVEVLMTPDHRSTSTLQQTAPRAWSRSTNNTSLVSKRSEPTSTDRKPYHANLHFSRRRSLDESQSPRSSAFLDQTGSRERSAPKSIIAAVAEWPVGNPKFLAFNMYSLRMHLRRSRPRPTA